MASTLLYHIKNEGRTKRDKCYGTVARHKHETQLIDTFIEFAGLTKFCIQNKSEIKVMSIMKQSDAIIQNQL